MKLKLVGQDGNAFNLISKFSNAAKKSGWTKKEINSVLDTCMSDNYDNLLRTLITHCEKQ